MNYIVATTKQWDLDVYKNNISQLDGNWFSIKEKKYLTLENIKKINPNYFVDASDFMDKNIQTLNCYNAEIRPYPHARSYQALKLLAQFRGSTVGLECAESFCIERIIK